MKIIPNRIIVQEIREALNAFMAKSNKNPEKIILTPWEWDRMLGEVKDKYIKDKVKRLKYSEYWKNENKSYRAVLLFGVPIEPEPKEGPH